MRKTLFLGLILCSLLACTMNERHESDSGAAARKAVAAKTAADAEALRVPASEQDREISQIAGDFVLASTLSMIRTINDPRLDPERRAAGIEIIRDFIARARPCNKLLTVKTSDNSSTAAISCADDANYTVDMRTGQIF